MSKHNLTGYYHQQIDLISSNDTWTIGTHAVVVSDNIGMLGSNTFTNNEIIVQGSVAGANVGMGFQGEGTKVTIAASGSVYGDAAVYIGADHTIFTNYGQLIGQSYGVAIEQFGGRLTNNGVIVAKDGMMGENSKVRIVNGEQGVIDATANGIQLNSDPDSNSRTVNHGTIRSDDVAFNAGAANDTLLNDGRMTGDIVLDDGNDTVDTRGGTVKGDILGGAGNDTLMTTNAKISLTELVDEGSDKVISTVGYKLSDNVEKLSLIGSAKVNGTGNAGNNELAGNAGDNILSGLAGKDALDGGFGDDILRGGFGGDLFGFATGYGKDTIADFDAGDHIYIVNWQAIDNFNQLKAHPSNHGADLWITAGQDRLIIENFHKADLQANDFDF